MVFHRSFPKLSVSLPHRAENNGSKQCQLSLEILHLPSVREPMPQATWPAGTGQMAAREMCPSWRLLRGREPHSCSLQEPDVPPLQHLDSTSWTHPGRGWVSQTSKLLCGDAQAKSPQQMVELNGTNSLAFHERPRVGSRVGTPLTSTATASDRCLLLSSLFPSLPV